MPRRISPQRMRKIDIIAYSLWRKYIQPNVGRSRKKLKVIRLLLEAGPLLMSSNPIIKKVIGDGRGTDGFQAAMMTWNYLAAICRYYEFKLRRKR